MGDSQRRTIGYTDKEMPSSKETLKVIEDQEQELLQTPSVSINNHLPPPHHIVDSIYNTVAAKAKKISRFFK